MAISQPRQEYGCVFKIGNGIFPSFEKLELSQIPCSKNAQANGLSKLIRSKDSDMLTVVPIEHLSRPPLLRVKM